MSLPGSDVNSIEQPAILQVLSPLNAAEEKIEKVQENPVNRVILLQQPSSEEPPQQPQKLHNDVNDDNSSDRNLVSSSNKSHLVITTPTPTPTPTPTKDCKIDPHTGEIIFPESQRPSQANILDIESHLIETYNELLYPNEESVGIKELTPIEDELQVGCSKIETTDNVRTVIEVQPAEVITKKPIEQVIATDKPLQAAQINVPSKLSNGESFLNKDEIEKIAEKLIQDLEEEIINTFSKIPSQENLNDNINEEKECEIVNEDNIKAHLKEKTENSAEIVETKQKLEEPKQANEKTLKEEVIEAIATTSIKVLKDSEPQSETPIEKAPESKQVSLDTTEKLVENTTETKLSEVVDQQLSEVTSILDSQTKVEDSLETPLSVKTENLQLPVDKHPNLKVVSVPSPKTALEEEERKLFIESLPHLQTHETTTNDDAAQQLALDCKREYYQSLKKYLVQSSADKPPIPLQTYRWEDLRRAKERVSNF